MGGGTPIWMGSLDSPRGLGEFMGCWPAASGWGSEPAAVQKVVHLPGCPWPPTDLKSQGAGWPLFRVGEIRGGDKLLSLAPFTFPPQNSFVISLLVLPPGGGRRSHSPLQKFWWGQGGAGLPRGRAGTMEESHILQESGSGVDLQSEQGTAEAVEGSQMMCPTLPLPKVLPTPPTRGVCSGSSLP